jgi:hypothetical protein
MKSNLHALSEMAVDKCEWLTQRLDRFRLDICRLLKGWMIVGILHLSEAIWEECACRLA